MPNTELVGSATNISWISAFGTVALNTDFRTWGNDGQQKSVPSTAGADTADQYLPTTTDGGYRLTMLHDGGTAYWSSLKPGLVGTLIWGEAGTASGKPKHTQPVFIETANFEDPYDNVEIWTISFKPMGPRVDAVYP